MELSYLWYAAAACLCTWLLTAAGAFGASVLPISGNEKREKRIAGISAGIMTAASFWSLLAPAGEQARQLPGWGRLLPTAGFFCGWFCIYAVSALLEKRMRDSENFDDILTVLAITVHNLPEGMAVGVAFGAAAAGTAPDYTGAWILTLGIALQNIPEGFSVSAPLKKSGHSAKRSFFWGQLSGAVEPVGGILGALLANAVRGGMVFLLSFAAGAMLLVVFWKMVPEAINGRFSTDGLLGCALGFGLMTFLDTVL